MSVPAPSALPTAPQGSTRELLRLAGPLMLSNLAYTAVGFTDTLLMGRLGVVEVGAVGFASLCLLTLVLLLRGSLNTAATFVARALGAGDPAGVRRWASVFLSCGLLGVPLALLAPWLLDTLFALLRPDAEIAAVARTYAHIRAWEIPLVMLGSAALSVMVGLGNTRTPMLLAWLVVAVNAALAVLFVFGFGWGWRGRPGPPCWRWACKTRWHWCCCAACMARPTAPSGWCAPRGTSGAAWAGSACQPG
ncbi:MATE family efflux transporter [Deinococcus multiflagellatus]|uniref:MATE family efflux transporter n=1 Tax=Deinococcus multiflagellatus TaxID=1656887 RepID=A0ABW1ZE52_9DEIO